MTLASFPTPPAAWAPADLTGAVLLELGATPIQSGSTALVDHLSTLVAGRDTRKRRLTDLVKLRRAVGAVVGGTLREWRKGRAVFRSRERSDFTGELIGVRQFVDAVDGLVQLGFLATSKAISYAYDFGDGRPGSVRRAARLRPTASLLDLAAEYRLEPGNVREQFGLEFSSTAPKIPAEPVTQRPLRTAYRGLRAAVPAGPVHQTTPDDNWTQGLAEEVHEANAFVAGFNVEGCLPPRWWRPFGPSWLLGGRWTALGRAGMYQGLSKAERAAITINGEATAEVDIHASHLSIMLGLLGLPLPEGDLYSVPGVPRAVAKRWIVATLGKGSAVGRRGWPKGAIESDPELAAFDPSEVGVAIMERYPFLAAPAEAVVDAAGLHDLAHLGTPGKLLPHRLMGIEAAGVSAAMTELRRAGLLALPVHDSLIVPTEAAGLAEGALERAFIAQAGGAIRTRSV